MADTISQTLINKFNEAISALNTAQDTVINGVARITDAQGQVNQAVQTANDAKTLAQTANENASAAVQTANTANDTANTANQNANTAIDDASTAVQTANAAQSTAEEASTTVASYDNEIEATKGAVMEAADLAGLSNRDIDAQKFTRNQVIDATIVNRGVIEGLVLSKSSTATRNLSATNGKIFMDGRVYTVSNQINTAHIANNTTSAAGTVIIYLIEQDGVMEIESTPLNEAIPDDGIEIARVTIPAGNTENNDPYLTNVTITDTARHEPAWPTVQLTAGQVYVPLNRTLPDAEYMVDVEIKSATSFHQLGQVSAANKSKNGFLLVTTGTADKIACRCHIKHPSL